MTMPERFTKATAGGLGRPAATLWPLAFAAAAIEAVLLWLTSLMYLPRFFPGKAGITLDFVKMLGPDWQRNTVLQFVAFSALFLAFGLALWCLRGAKPSRALLAKILLRCSAAFWTNRASLKFQPR